MENETGLVKSSEVKLPKFVEQAYDSIEGMKQFANMLLESKLVPDSYYEKGADNKPDYNKGKTSAVVIVLLQSQQLNVPPMTGLQHIVPVNGLLSIKGDLAKTMIFASGKLRKDSWKETVTGSIESEDMVVTITATREDNGISLTRSFSVDKAKRMGLWVTSAMASGTDGWKWKKSAWHKTPDRMLNYRALGNIARDLFSDVLLNMYTTEEAVDIQRDTTEVIETESGAKITIPDKEHAKGRSTKMTDRVADKIPDNKFGDVKKDNIQDAVIVGESKNEAGQIIDSNMAPEGKLLLNKSENAPITQTIMQPAVTNVSNPPVKKEPQSSFQDQMNALETMGKDKDESLFIPSKGSVEYQDGKQVDRLESHAIEGSKTDGKWTLAEMEKMDTPILLKVVMEDMDMMEAAEMIGGKNTNKKLREIIFSHQNNGLTEYVAPFLKAQKEREEQEAAVAAKANIPVDTSKGEIPINKAFDQMKPEGTPIP